MAYANLGEETFTLTDDEEVIHAVMWSLYPPPDGYHLLRALNADESRTSVASGIFVLFSDAVTSAVMLGMHNCLGLTVLCCD